MNDTSILIDDIQSLIFLNTSLINLMQGYCIMAKDNIEEMEYLTQGFEIMIENQKKIQTKFDAVSDNIFKTAYSKYFK